MEYEHGIMIVCGVFLVILVIYGLASGEIYVEEKPTELENGCIVYGDKVYCEEVNEVGG